jgi:crotonobetainyl-CoA:carnitine CoA-transferase CaiB-like acyl-CoA transferase
VIKVEAPVRYDPTRTMAAVLEGDAGPEGSATFAHLNSGKLGVTIDLNTEAGRDVVRDLVRWADVVVESFTPGVMERWGLGYESLRAVNPRFVMLSTSLMGQTGPLAEFAGFGNLAGAISGFYELTGWPDRSPAGPYLAYTDYVSPRFLLAALLASLDLRARTGEGQHLDVSQYEASIHFLAPALLEFAVTGVEPTRAGNTDKNAHPHGVFRCAGGSEAWIAVACETDEQRAALASVVGEATEAALAAWAQAHDVPAAEAAFQAVGVPAHGVQNSVGCLADPQLIHRGHFVDVEHAVHPHCIVEGPRAKLSETPGRVVRANPMLGEHNAAVLRELLGYDEDRYVELLVAGVLG